MSWYLHNSGQITRHRISDSDVPVVVISPEDREQVERLAAAYQKAVRGDLPAAPNEGWMQTALRSLVTPPKPDEPTGLGAVVEAVCDCQSAPKRYVYDPQSDRFEMRPGGKGKPWKSACGHHVWADLDRVRVLSEGVQP